MHAPFGAQDLMSKTVIAVLCWVNTNEGYHKGSSTPLVALCCCVGCFTMLGRYATQDDADTLPCRAARLNDLRMTNLLRIGELGLLQSRMLERCLSSRRGLIETFSAVAFSKTNRIMPPARRRQQSNHYMVPHTEALAPWHHQRVQGTRRTEEASLLVKCRHRAQ